MPGLRWPHTMSQEFSPLHLQGPLEQVCIHSSLNGFTGFTSEAIGFQALLGDLKLLTRGRQDTAGSGLLPGGRQDCIDGSPGGELRPHTRSWWEGSSFHGDLPRWEAATGHPGPQERRA